MFVDEEEDVVEDEGSVGFVAAAVSTLNCGIFFPRNADIASSLLPFVGRRFFPPLPLLMVVVSHLET
jgi:hypothetical protein